MRITVNIDDALYAKAVELTGAHEKTGLLNEGLKALIERESARRLALLSSCEPGLQPILCRKTDQTK
jgi:Arc/MetJ family transcription regulator